MNLQDLLPQLIPQAVAWADFQSKHIMELGAPLSELGLEVARQVGVKNPALVRVKIVDEIPVPEEPLLKQVALETGLMGPDMKGMTLGYGIFIVQGHDDVRLISHELRHVYQYETLGGIENFIPVYLEQIASFGYHAAPLEQDARSREVSAV